jgi:hypothetical protein
MHDFCENAYGEDMRITIFGLRPLRTLSACMSLSAFLAACGGGNVSLSPQTSSQSLAAATSQTCFTPSTQAQNVALPSTGGITGTLAIAAGSATATSCDVAVTLTTGSAVTTIAANVRHAESGTPAKPILEISLDNAFTNNVEMTGAVLNTPPNLSFPDGTYQALVTSGTLPPTVLVFTAMNGVLTLASTGSPILIAPGTSATLTLYAKGVTPPDATPSPSPSAAASPSATPTAAPTATASVTPTALPTATAAPSGSTIVASSITLSPGATCIDVGFDAQTYSYSASAVTNASPGTQLYYGWRLGGGGSLTVPPPTTNLSYLPSDDPQYGATAGPANTATISFDSTSTTYGYGANLTVFVLYPPNYPNYLGLSVIYLPDGKTVAEANVVFELGLNTCAAQGFATHTIPGVRERSARLQNTVGS